MTLHFITTAVTDQFVSALCNTLVHSLWQGLLLAAIAGLIIVFTKKATSAMRYNLLIAALVMFAVGVGITFLVQFNYTQTIAQNTQVATSTVLTAVNTTAPAIHAANIDSSFSNMLYGYLNKYHNTIVLIWFLIICAKSIQLGTGLYGTYHLKRSNTIAIGSYWNERVQQLAAMLGIKQTISLLESGLAKVPMVIGHLKPVILIPVGLLSALSAEEVEAIIVHELAHIKRRDYLVNLLQSLMEIVFFFNPAVLWISQLIKTERENCCDDLALAQSSNKISYIRALVSCEEYKQALPAYAMAFAGSKNSLLDRVKRLASNRNHSLNIYEKTALAICLVVSGLCMSAFAERETIKRTVHEVVKSFEHTTINKVEQQKLVEQTNLLKQQTAQLKHTSTSLIDSSGQSALDTNKRRLAKPIPPVPPVIAAPIPAVASAPMVAIPPMNVQVKPMIAMAPMRVKVTIPSVKPMVAMAPMNVPVAIPSMKPMPAMAPMNVKLSAPLGPVSVTDAVIDSVNVSVHTNVSVKSNGNTSKAPSSTNNAYKSTTPDIGDELLKAHLIKDKTNFTIKLTNDELIINGVKQSEENHQVILKKYQKKPSDKVNINVSESNHSHQSTRAFSNPNLFTTFLPQNC